MTKPLVLRLNRRECEELLLPAPSGGFQAVHTLLTGRLRRTRGGGGVVALTDAEFGKVVRCATQYGSGGYQERLQRAIFLPFVRMWLGLPEHIPLTEPDAGGLLPFGLSAGGPDDAGL